MPINPIQSPSLGFGMDGAGAAGAAGVGPVQRALGDVPPGTGMGEGEGNFASDLTGLLQDVSSLQRRSSEATEALVRGEPINLHEVIIRQEEARIAFDAHAAI